MRFRMIKRRNEQGQYLLQLTSMVDMFTIILVFLLKSYSTSAYQITPSDQITLPLSESQQDPEEGVKIIVSNQLVSVGDAVVMQWQGESGWKKFLHKKNDRFLPVLHNSLNEQGKQSEALQEINDKINVKKRLVLQIDKNTSYVLLKTIMATASLAGFNDFNLLTLKE